MRRAGSLLIVVALGVALVVPFWLGGSQVVFAGFELTPRHHLCIGLLMLIGWSLRATKQWLLIRRLGMHVGAWRNFGMSLAIDFAFLATPGGVGGYAAGIYYLRGIGASYAAATTVAAADQVLDLLFFAVALPLAALALSRLHGVPPILAESAAFGGFAMLAGLAVLWLARGPMLVWLFGPRGPFGRWRFLRRHRESVRGFIDNFGAQMGLLRQSSPRYFVCALLCTAGQWLARYGLLWLILKLLGHPVPFALILLLQGVVLHLAQWTGMPAGGGAADLGLAAALAPFVPTPTIAGALFLWRIVTLHLPLAAGALAIALLRWRGKPALA